MFFNQFLNPAGAGGLGGAGGNGLGSLASLIAMGAGNGGGVAPVLPQPGAVPQSGPAGSPIPPAPQPPQSSLLQSLLADPQRLRQMLMGLGLGSYGFGNGANMANGSPGLINSLLASPDFHSGPGTGGGGAY